MLPAHNARATTLRKAQQQGKLVNRVRRAAHAALDQPSKAANPSEPGNPLGGQRTRALAKTRHVSLSGAGATTCLRARPMDSIRIIPASEFVILGRRMLGSIDQYMAQIRPCCGQRHASYKDVIMYAFEREQRFNQHQTLLHAMSLTLK